MEALLQFVWQQRLWTSLSPVGTLEGCEIEILDVGLCNNNAGPDFLEAKVRIDDITWVGAVEIHTKASEWLQHEHHLDSTYAGVILHVVEQYDSPIYGHNGRMLPTLVLSYPDDLRERASYLIQHASQLPCAPLAPRLSPQLISTHLDNLCLERLRQKARHIKDLALQHDWHEALYITLMRYSGSELNNDPMEQLAKALPYKLIARYSDRSEQFEALLIGEAGLLDKLPHDEYREHLEQEYAFLAQKHLLPQAQYAWRYARTRPQAFPLRRLLQASAIVRKSTFSPSRLLASTGLDALRDYFVPMDLGNYWKDFFHSERTKASLSYSREALDALILNVALPYTLAYYLESKDEETIQASVLKVMHQLSPEEHRITRTFARAGIKARHAGDTQAFVQCYNEYCKRHKCIYCPWGRRLLAQP